MATVFFMKFNPHQGGLIADEMTWHLGFKYGYRPSRYGDAILNLVSKDVEDTTNFASVYAGVGFPSLHFEVVLKARKKLEEEGIFGDLDRVSSVVEDIYQDVHGRFINDKLRFLFGFTRDELNRCEFEFMGKKYKINQDLVVKEAKKILKYQDKSDAYHRIFDNEGLVMGYDKENGIRAYHISNEGRSLDFAYPFDAIGPGKEIGTKIFADTNARMHLEERRRGFEFVNGLFLLLNCFVEAYDFNIKTGGYFQVFLIDGKREHLPHITKEVNDHRMYVSAEVIRAYRWGYIDKERAMELIRRALLEDENWQDIESAMWEYSTDPDSLKKYLMGYRPVNTPKMPMF